MLFSCKAWVSTLTFCSNLLTSYIAIASESRRSWTAFSNSFSYSFKRPRWILRSFSYGNMVCFKLQCWTYRWACRICLRLRAALDIGCSFSWLWPWILSVALPSGLEPDSVLTYQFRNLWELVLRMGCQLYSAVFEPVTVVWYPLNQIAWLIHVLRLTWQKWSSWRWLSTCPGRLDIGKI